MAKTTLTPEQFQRIVQALADPNRYEMLTRVYASDEAISCTCAKGDLKISDGTGSHHLHELMAADLICVARDGRHRMLSPRRDVWEAFMARLEEI
jgi:DNA-binding transcriptional ArsR family regulator